MRMVSSISELTHWPHHFLINCSGLSIRCWGRRWGSVTLRGVTTTPPFSVKMILYSFFLKLFDHNNPFRCQNNYLWHQKNVLLLNVRNVIASFIFSTIAIFIFHKNICVTLKALIAAKSFNKPCFKDWKVIFSRTFSLTCFLREQTDISCSIF